mmetsp:Transcript_114631/g.214638  ORF Transcript_114631/g.214638 Transcript_114631/m.214638 type:complete len:83 (-) Transcript_114631:190-438(-)
MGCFMTTSRTKLKIKAMIAKRVGATPRIEDRESDKLMTYAMPHSIPLKPMEAHAAPSLDVGGVNVLPPAVPEALPAEDAKGS